MYVLITLFFASLLGIVFMLGRKLAMIKNGTAQFAPEEIPARPYIEEWKEITIRNMKKHGYLVLISTIRLYVKSSGILKIKYQEIRMFVQKIAKKNLKNISPEPKEVNGFLKMIADYKHKIRQIKHQIKEEEKIP